MYTVESILGHFSHRRKMALLVLDLSPQTPRFTCRPVHMGFVVGSGTWPGFSLSFFFLFFPVGIILPVPLTHSFV